MIKNKNNWIYLVFLLLLCLPTYAYADAGTPLMWVAGFHLLIGNAIVGILEGVIIAKIFHVKFRRSIFIMMLANYFSMFAGCYGIFLLSNHLDSFASIYNLSYILIGLGIASYLLTILLEWPFTYWVLKGKENRTDLSFKANLIAQTASYALLILIYLSCSGISLITKTKIDSSLSFLKNKNAWVYYLSPKSEILYKIKADGANKQKIGDTGINNEYAQLSVCSDNGKADLQIRWYENVKNQNRYQTINKYKILVKNLPGITEIDTYTKYKFTSGGQMESTKTNVNCGDMEAPWFRMESNDFRPEDKRNWSVYTGTWAIEGLSGKNKKTGKKFWIALETPFLMWPIINATILPGDQVICQIGNQIAAVDLNTLQIGLITFGRSPTVTFEK